MMAMTSSGTAAVTLPTEMQILITRTFEAPRHLVYKAYTTPSSSSAGGAATMEWSRMPKSISA